MLKNLGILLIIVTFVIILIKVLMINQKFYVKINLFLSKFFMLIKKDKMAKKFLLNVISKMPNNWDAHVLLGSIYEKEGGMRKAIDEYVKAVDINKKDYNSYYKIAYILNSLDKKEEAIQMLNNLYKIKPDFIKSTQLLGKLLCEKEEFKDAINVYQTLLKYEPDNYDVLYTLGMLYTNVNDFKNAKMYYEKAAILNALEYNGIYSLGIISLLYNDMDEAEKYFIKGIENPNIEAESLYQLARIYIIKNQNERAVKYLYQAIHLNTDYARKAQKDNIFLGIEKYIPKQINDFKSSKPKLTKLEQITIKHLEDTYYIIKKMNRNSVEQEKGRGKDNKNYTKEEREA